MFGSDLNRQYTFCIGILLKCIIFNHSIIKGNMMEITEQQNWTSSEMSWVSPMIYNSQVYLPYESLFVDLSNFTPATSQHHHYHQISLHDIPSRFNAA